MNVWQVISGDCDEVLDTLEVEFFDSMVTDPPSGIGFMGKSWDSYGSLLQFQDALTTTFVKSIRVLKPGAQVLVWALPRTSHHTACALERAGFEIRDMFSHIFGQGMPKGLNVAGGLPPEIASKWEGWNTALKPAHEVWWLARKPLIGTVVENITRYGVGGINIDDCRVGTSKNVPSSVSRTAGLSYSGSVDGSLRRETGQEGGHDPNLGRWPTNLILSHAPDCREAQCGEGCPVFELYKQVWKESPFFYTPKVSAGERKLKGRVNSHPTVKPVALMRYLVRLVTPPGGIVLDPFAGSGSTGVAALKEGFQFVGVELDTESCEIANLRLADAVSDYESRQIAILSHDE